MGAKKKRAREGDTPCRLCPANSFPFEGTVVMDKSSLEKLLRITTVKKKRVKQQRQSPSYDTLAFTQISQRSGFESRQPRIFSGFLFATA